MKLSIIIAAYNAEKYIEETLLSAIHQSIVDKEILIVNDGSTDRTVQIVSQYLVVNSVKLLNLRYNQGAAHAYAYGVLHSAGDYITFLDADDLYFPMYCERLIEFIENQQADMGFSNYQAIDGTQLTNTTLYGAQRHPNSIYAFGAPTNTFPNGNTQVIRRLSLLIDGVNISPRSIYRRNLFFDYGLDDHRLRISNDWLRNLRFVLNGAKCVYLDEILGYYRYHSEGNSQKDEIGNIAEIVKVYEIVINEMRALLSEEELEFAKIQLKRWRFQLFRFVSQMDISTEKAIQFLLDKKF